MILLPSRGRPDKLQRFFDEGKPEVPGMVLLDVSDEENYSSVDLPDNWDFRVRPDSPIWNHLNGALMDNPFADFYGLLADDVIPKTPRWDLILKAAAGKDKIAWARDGHLDRPSHMFIGGDLVKKLGYISPGMKHLYIDTFWEDLAHHFDLGVFCPEVLLFHAHFTRKHSEYDETYQGRPPGRDDKKIYDMLNWAEIREKLNA